MANDSVKIDIEVATKAAEMALKKFQEQTEKNTSAFDVFKGAFAAGLSVEAVKGAFSAVVGVFGSFIGEAAEAEQSLRNMEIALANSGRYSVEASKGFQDLGDSIEQTTIYSGDAAQATVAQLASLTSLTNEGIRKATLAATDLAATLGVDLGTATDLITKAINGNVGAFNKFGISIKAGETSAENLANVLTALTSQQGAAQRTAETYTGAMTQLENVKGKLFESIGKLVTQNPAFIGGLKASAEMFGDLAEWVETNAEDIKLFAEAFGASIVIVGAAALGLKAYAVVAASASGAMGLLSTAASAAWAAITGPVGLAVAGVVVLGAAIFATVKYWDDIKAATLGAAAALLEYTAAGIGVFSQDAATNLRDKAKALREEAVALRENTATTTENTSAVKNNTDAKAVDFQKQQELRAKDLQERMAFTEQLIAIEGDKNFALQETEIAHQAAMLQIGQENAGTSAQVQVENETSALERRQAHETAMLQETINAENARIALIVDAAERRKAAEAAAYKQGIESSKLAAKQELEVSRQKAKSEEVIQRERINNQRSTFATISSLSQSNNQNLAAIGKAAGIAQIAIDTPVAISKALASAPPPFNFALAALVGTAMAAQAANIAGLNFATGGVVPGTSYSGDRVKANVNSGEMILNRQQQAKLFKIANGNGGGDSSTTNILLAELIDAVRSNQSININGREIISVVRDGLASGRTV